MLQGEHSAIFLTFIKLPFVIKIFVLSIFEWSFYTGVTVDAINTLSFSILFILPLVLNPLYTSEFLHLVQYNNPGMVHCKYQGETGLNFKIKMNSSRQRFVLPKANSAVQSLMKYFVR